MTTFYLPAARENCLKEIEALPAWKNMEVVIKLPQKSNQQRNYWHKLIDILADEVGETPEDLKDKLKISWLPMRTVTVKGKEYTLPASSEKLNKQEYSLLIDKTLMMFDALNLVAPMPGYYGYDFKRREA